MDRKVAKYSSSQGIGGKKPCIVRITRSSRPRWLSKMISLPLDAQMNSYANKLSKMFSSPKSALIITSSIALPKEIFGRNTELEPIKCTITHINFLTNNLKIILHSSTKAKLLAAYSHFLTTWPLRHALQPMKELLRKKFIQDMEKLKWKVGCEVLKCADRQGRGNLQDLHSRIASSFQGESDKGRRKKEPGKTSPPIAKFPIGLEDLLEGAVEAIKSLFVPGLPASVPVNIWGIPWRVSKDNIKRFIQGNNTEKGSNYYPFEDAIETRSRRSFPTKRERVPRTDEESDEESEWESDGEDDEEEDDEILETIVLAPYIPVAAPPVLSKFQITVRYFESNFLRLYNLQRKRYDDSHPVAVPLTARVKYKQSREILKPPTQYGTKRSREDSESSSDSGSFAKRTKFNKTGRISSYGTAPLGQVSRPNILANTQNSQTQHGVRGKRSRSESSSSPGVFVPAKRLKSHRPANISETSNGSKFRRPSISSASTGYRTESEHYEIADCKHGMLEDGESSDHERQQQTRNQSHMGAVYATNSDDEIRFPTPPLSTEMESMESDDDETETDEWSEESEAEPVWPSRCQGGKFKSGYEESAAAREWYYV